MPYVVIARSEATKQSRLSPRRDSGLLRFARNDDGEAGSRRRRLSPRQRSLIPRLQPVPDPRLGQHILWALRIGFDLLAELADVDAQILRIGQLVPEFLQ